MRAVSYSERATAPLPGQPHAEYGTVTVLRPDAVVGLHALGPTVSC